MENAEERASLGHGGVDDEQREASQHNSSADWIIANVCRPKKGSCFQSCTDFIRRIGLFEIKKSVVGVLVSAVHVETTQDLLFVGHL